MMGNKIITVKAISTDALYSAASASNSVSGGKREKGGEVE